MDHSSCFAALMKYRLYVDSMPVDGSDTLEADVIGRIRQRGEDFINASAKRNQQLNGGEQKESVDVGMRVGCVSALWRIFF